MKVRGLLVGSVILAAAMAAFAFYASGQVPPGTELPVHWSAAGEVNGTLPALKALLFPVWAVIGCALFFAIIPRIEPLQDGLEGSAEVLRTTWIGLLFIMVLIQAAAAAPAFGIELPVVLPLLGVGLFFILIGNVLPKSRPGFFVGIRTPWAILDTDNWIATHRLGGKLMMLAGLAVALSALPVNRDLRVITLGASLAITIVPPFAYSWWLWHRKMHGRHEAGQPPTR
jgi:uncharacterized membrane protein